MDDGGMEGGRDGWRGHPWPAPGLLWPPLALPLQGPPDVRPQGGLAPSTLFPNSPPAAPIARCCLACGGGLGQNWLQAGCVLGVPWGSPGTPLLDPACCSLLLLSGASSLLPRRIGECVELSAAHLKGPDLLHFLVTSHPILTFAAFWLRCCWGARLHIDPGERPSHPRTHHSHTAGGRNPPTHTHSSRSFPLLHSSLQRLLLPPRCFHPIQRFHGARSFFSSEALPFLFPSFPSFVPLITTLAPLPQFALVCACPLSSRDNPAARGCHSCVRESSIKQQQACVALFPSSTLASRCCCCCCSWLSREAATRATPAAHTAPLAPLRRRAIASSGLKQRNTPGACFQDQPRTGQDTRDETTPPLRSANSLSSLLLSAGTRPPALQARQGAHYRNQICQPAICPSSRRRIPILSTGNRPDRSRRLPET